jgi:protein-tyrosine phosphatase
MYKFEKNNPIVITNFKWAGKLGPIEIKSSCNECDVTTNMLAKMIEEKFKDKNVVLEAKPWLNNIFYCLARGVWHAPIIIVNGKKFFQFSEKKAFFDRNKLIDLVNDLLVKQAATKAEAIREMEHKHIQLSYNKVEELIFAGNNLCCQSQFDEELLSKGINADISLEAERMDNPRGVKYFFWFPWKEDTAPPVELMNLAMRVVDALISQNIKMYVHCRNGHGRTTTFLASYYIHKGMRAEEALSHVLAKRPSGHLNDIQRFFLEQYEKELK